MDDAELVKRIDDLVEEEHRLEREHAADGLGEADQVRMSDLEVRLDQAWDLLRRRRARRQAGLDPDGAETRSGQVVEGYQQ